MLIGFEVPDHDCARRSPVNPPSQQATASGSHPAPVRLLLMEKLAPLKFDNPNNACMSLRCIAEWVRTGNITLTHTPVQPSGNLNVSKVLGLQIHEPKGRSRS